MIIEIEVRGLAKRQAFRDQTLARIHYANGYFYVGEYQPQTNTGRYFSREAAVRAQLDAYDSELTYGR